MENNLLNYLLHPDIADVEFVRKKNTASIFLVFPLKIFKPGNEI